MKTATSTSLYAVLIFASACGSIYAQESGDSAKFFESRVKPIFENKCYGCHTDLQRGGLRLDSRHGLLKGGNDGAAIVPGKPDQSLLIQAVRHTSEKLKMPLGGKLSDAEIDDLTTWVAMGAPWPQSGIEQAAADLFTKRCANCHKGDRPPGGIDLTSIENAGRGTHTFVTPGKPEESLLWRAVDEKRMPPGQPLSEPELATLREWIDGGAPGLPKTAELHWSFTPPRRPAIPAVTRPETVRNPIDSFIISALEKKGLSLSPEADKRTLVRRVSFDLTGLPPTPQAVEEFLKDESPGAYDRMLERYLASPQYGERWGQYWLDAVGYADSNGYWTADTDRPLAYKYRDYVIRSFNNDKPFDRFLLEQLAGDALAGYKPGSEVTPEMTELLTATHMLRNAMDGTGESDGNPDEVAADKYAVLEGNVQILGSTFLGLTVQCARCHNHKFEPITQKEYYQLQAILKPAYNHDTWTKPKDRKVCVGSIADCEANHAAIEASDRGLKAAKASLKGLIDPFRQLIVEDNLKQLDESLQKQLREALDTKESQRSDEMKRLLKDHATVVTVEEKQVLERFPDLASSHGSLTEVIRKREAERPTPLPHIAALTDVTPNPPSHHLLNRGAYTDPGVPVDPGVPATLTSPENTFNSPAAADGSDGRPRFALARWLTSPQNPTVGRMQVNRIWLQHFGTGIVTTPENFGITGSRPSHPELLDYLATEFVNSKWSIKALHRLILTSATYRQTGAMNARAHEIDPDNQLLWRFPLRRLEAEAVRDAILQVSGELDLTQGGPYIPIKRLETGQIIVEEATKGVFRRSVYLQHRRTQPVSLLESFDAPDLSPNCVRRPSSTVSLQSLALLNSDFVRNRSRAFARVVLESAPATVQDKFNLATQLAYGRPATADEQAAAAEFLRVQRPNYVNVPDAEQRAWSDLCQMLLASSNFLYVE